MTYWLLDDDNVPRRCTLAEWPTGDEARRVAWTALHSMAGASYVSTVFLGVDHNFNDSPSPMFETMVSRLDGEWENEVRYHTWDEAVHGHKMVVAKTIDWLAKALIAARV